MASAFIRPQGHSGQILRALVERRAFELVLSTPILSELKRVMFYPRLRKELQCTDEEVEARVASVGILADLADGNLEIHVVRDDPDDDKYLVAAVLGRATTIVSGDHHVLEIGEYQGITMVTPRQFLSLLSVPS